MSHATYMDSLGHKEECTFAASDRTEQNSLETRISEILWRWRFAKASDRERVVSDSQLALMLEYWFPFNEIPFTQKLGTWCDGIPLLTVSDLSRTTFSLAGVGYFPHDFSPFELDFHYKARRDPLTTKIIFRFGIVARGGGLQTFSISASPEKVFAQRPRETRDWAVAVELTPP